MKKQVIRLTESDLHNIINEAVTNVLIEEGWFGDKMGKAAGWARNQLGDFWNSMKGGYQQARTNNPYANKQYGTQAPTAPQQNTTTTPQGRTTNNSFGKPNYGEQPNLQNYNPQNFGGNGMWGNNQKTTAAAAPQAQTTAAAPQNTKGEKTNSWASEENRLKSELSTAIKSLQNIQAMKGALASHGQNAPNVNRIVGNTNRVLNTLNGIYQNLNAPTSASNLGKGMDDYDMQMMFHNNESKRRQLNKKQRHL